MRTSRRLYALRRAAAAAMIAVMLTPTFGAHATAPRPTVIDLAAQDWVWPVSGFRLERPYVAPAHRYGTGHRGIDLRLYDDLAVRAPAPGVVAFVGAVAGRGILTIDHGSGLVSTFEPVESTLTPGDLVGEGDAVGSLTLGGHALPGALHFGVRLDGEYINPLLLLGGIPRSVLLPCC